MWDKRTVILLFLALGLAGGLVTGSRVAVAAPPGQAATATLPPNRVEVRTDATVRAGPGTDYDRVGVIITGQTSQIVGRNPEGTWFEIEYVGGPNGIGWVSGDVVHVVGDVNTMPTILPP